MIGHSDLRSLTEEIKGHAIEEDSDLIIDLCENYVHRSVSSGKIPRDQRTFDSVNKNDPLKQGLKPRSFTTGFREDP